MGFLSYLSQVGDAHFSYFIYMYAHSRPLSIVVIAILQVLLCVILAQIIGIDAAITRSAGMNVNSGGPHILLFERDQQLTGLLTSEFQLAGYECHAARTAVEVFDAIARFPIRLVLVNLAQAAASRREFWVALDAQRRGRGVQVLTFHCSNIANYGPKDPDEHAATMVD